MELEKSMQDLKETIESTASTKAVFGAAYESNGMQIIPVSKVNIFGGAGSGQGKDTDPNGNSDISGGKGFGLGVKTQPVGFITVKSDSVVFSSISDTDGMLKRIIPFAGVAFVIIVRALFRKRK